MATFANYSRSAILATTLSVNPTGTNRFIVVGVLSASAPSAVTVGGNAMTPFANSINLIGFTTRFYYRIAPDTGSQNVAVSGGGDVYFIQAWTYTDADQTTPLRSTTLVGYTDNTGTAQTSNITTEAGDLVTDFLLWADSATSTPGAGQTEIADDFTEGYGFGSTWEEATTTTTTMSHTLSTSRTAGHIVWAVRDAGGDPETLTIDSQPSTATSGVAMGNVVISSSDSASTATVTATIQSGGGSLSGTTSAAMTAGEVTFSNLIITGSGAHTLEFTATGHDPVTSATITVSSGGSSAGAKFIQNLTNTQETAMRVIPSNTATAALRRIPFTLVDATDGATPEDITVTGVKVALSIDGGTSANSTNDIVKVDGATGRYYLELTQTEANQTAGAIVFGRLAPSGCWPREIAAQIGPANVFASDVSVDAASVRTAVGLASANLDTQLSTIDTVVDAIEVDTQNIQSRLPAALVSGRIDASVGAMATNTLTAAAIAANAITSAKIATDAIGSAQLAATAVTEIQSGLATAAALTTVDNEIAALQTSANNIEADTQDIQSRLPAALSNGRILAHAKAVGDVVLGEGGVAPGSPIGEVV